MQYLLSVIHDGPSPEVAEEQAAIEVFNDALQRDGYWVFAGGLGLPTNASVVDNRAGEPVITDGPFVETKEWLVGFYILDCATEEQALERAASICDPNHAIEVRPVNWRWRP